MYLCILVKNIERKVSEESVSRHPGKTALLDGPSGTRYMQIFRFQDISASSALRDRVNNVLDNTVSAEVLSAQHRLIMTWIIIMVSA